MSPWNLLMRINVYFIMQQFDFFLIIGFVVLMIFQAC